MKIRLTEHLTLVPVQGRSMAQEGQRLPPGMCYGMISRMHFGDLQKMVEFAALALGSAPGFPGVIIEGNTLEVFDRDGTVFNLVWEGPKIQNTTVDITAQIRSQIRGKIPEEPKPENRLWMVYDPADGEVIVGTAQSVFQRTALEPLGWEYLNELKAYRLRLPSSLFSTDNSLSWYPEFVDFSDPGRVRKLLELP